MTMINDSSQEYHEYVCMMCGVRLHMKQESDALSKNMLFSDKQSPNDSNDSNIEFELHGLI
jgi:hypothetical protein